MKFIKAFNSFELLFHGMNFISEELTGKYKEETDIIYRDKNIVCLIPKSQMTSYIYGRKTAWCQVQKSGFDGWSGKFNPENKLALLIRFLFKNGRKIRFTYFINNNFYWTNENGAHVLSGEGNNPFNIKQPKTDRIRETEKDILDQINLIPQECKDRVLDFIEKNKKYYKYIYREEEYFPDKINKTRKEFDRILDKWEKKITHINYEGKKNYIRSFISKDGNIYIDCIEGSKHRKSEKFKPNQIKEFEKRLEELIHELSI